MYNRTLEVQRTLNGRVAPGENVVFDEESIFMPGISYDTLTGEITFIEIGQYIVRWWVVSETTPRGSVEFGLKSSSQDEIILGSSPIKTGLVSGLSAIDVTAAGTTLSLINATENNTVFSRDVQLKAYLLITPIENVVPAGADGHSAYHEEIDEGFEGTEEEWLTSLVGICRWLYRNCRHDYYFEFE